MGARRLVTGTLLKLIQIAVELIVVVIGKLTIMIFTDSVMIASQCI